MKKRCSVPGCISETPERVFYKLPSDPQLRKVWMNKCLLTTYTSYTFICSAHFEKSSIAKETHRKSLLKDAIPTLDLPSESLQLIPERKNTYIEIDSDSGESNSIAPIPTKKYESKNVTLSGSFTQPQSDKSIQVNILTDIGKKKNNIIWDIISNEQNLSSWTGLTYFEQLKSIETYSMYELDETSDVSQYMPSMLSMQEKILLVFIKLNTNLTFSNLSFLFDVSTHTVSKIFTAMLPILKAALKSAVFFPNMADISAKIEKLCPSVDGIPTSC